MKLPSVSVCVITFNHAQFIEIALRSICNQNYDGEIEVIIGDDCSSDNTAELIQTIAAEHSDIKWVLKLRDKNIGISRNFADVILSASGEFIAILEGDDYWIDPYKLTKQVNALQENPSANICFSHCNEVNEYDGRSKIIGQERPSHFSIDYLLQNGWFMRTPTLLFRNHVIQKFPDWFYTSYSTDYILHLLLAEHGDVVKISDVTAAYRKHDGGISVTGFENQIKRYQVKLNLLDTIDGYFKGVYRRHIAIQKEMIYAQLVLDAIRKRSLNPAIFSMMSLGGILAFFNLVMRKAFNSLFSK